MKAGETLAGLCCLHEIRSLGNIDNPYPCLVSYTPEMLYPPFFTVL
jgi:hypothetical protein